MAKKALKGKTKAQAKKPKAKKTSNTKKESRQERCC
jgi:hypothetical protein